MTTTPATDKARDAMMAATVMECDWDFLLVLHDEAEMPLAERRRRYWAACRERLLADFGWAPHPFGGATEGEDVRPG